MTKPFIKTELIRLAPGKPSRAPLNESAKMPRFAEHKGTLPSSNGKTINEDVPVSPKQLIGHVDIDEQQSGMAFCVVGFL